MAVQKIVERFSRKGVIGQTYDSSLQRTLGKKVYGGETAAFATLAVTIATNPAANDTVTIGGVEYKFVSSLSSPAALNEVKIGTAAADTAANLKDAIIGGTGGSTFSANQPANPLVSATASSAVVTLKALMIGEEGNSIGVSTSVAAKITFPSAYLLGGADENRTAIVGRLFTYDATDPDKVVMGQTGAVAGVFKGPYQLANYNNLKDTLGVRNGTTGEIMSFGRVWVRVVTDVTTASKVFYNNTDGSFAGASGDSLTGYTKLANARYLGSASAGDIVGVELSY